MSGHILSIDPGTLESGYVIFDRANVVVSGVLDNDEMLELVRTACADELAIEMVASYGMPVGREVFETCVWIGRFIQAWRAPSKPMMVYRKDVKLHLCGSQRAKDGNIRQALLDMLGPQGTKRAPGPLYGVKSHAWSALAVAVVAAHQLERNKVCAS